MKKTLLLVNLLVSLAALPQRSIGQVLAPTLGNAAGFTMFTAVGAFNNVGPSRVQGDIGTNIGAFTGFAEGQGVLSSGSIHVVDATSTMAATDVQTAYTYANSITNLTTLPVYGGTPFQTLLPGAYVVGEATTLAGTLILDAKGNPDAVFFLRVSGALTTAEGSAVTLTGGALARNVYWQTTGRVILGRNSMMRGTLLVDGAIDLIAGATLQGRALSRAGAISLDTNTIIALSMGVPLPVELVSFTVIRQDGSALIKWTTASEHNSKSFRVERSTTGTADWQTIANVVAAGTSTSLKQYSALDTRVTSDVAYYRLRSTDLDNTFSYSQVRAISVVVATSQSVMAFPNPTTDRLTIIGASPGSLLTLTDLSGKIHRKQTVSATGVELLETSALHSGIYLLHLISDQGQKSTVKVSKE